MKDIGLLVLRISFSAMMVPHGFGKLQKVLNGNFNFANPLGIGEAPSLVLAVFGEFVCPILIIIGFKSRWAAIPAAFTMFVAAFITHWDDPFSKKELALLYFFGFVATALLGPGKYSIDRK